MKLKLIAMFFVLLMSSALILGAYDSNILYASLNDSSNQEISLDNTIVETHLTDRLNQYSYSTSYNDGAYSSVIVNNSFLAGNFVFSNRSYVILDNVTIGDESNTAYIFLENSSLLEIRNSKIQSILAYASGNARIIIEDSIIHTIGWFSTIYLHDESTLEIRNVACNNSYSYLYITPLDSSKLIIDNYNGRLTIDCYGNSYFEINNVNATNFEAYLQQNSSGVIQNLYNASSSSLIYILLKEDSNIAILNSSYINQVYADDASFLYLYGSNASNVYVRSFYSYISPGSWAVINQSNIESLYISSPKITEIYSSTINTAYVLWVVNSTDAIIIRSVLQEGSYYLPIRAESSAINNIENETWGLFLVNSNVLITNSTEASLYLVSINSDVEVNGSSALLSVYLHNESSFRIYDRSGFTELYVYGRSNAIINDADFSSTSTIYAYDGSSVVIDGLNTSGLSVSFYFAIYDSYLSIINSDFYHLGRARITSYGNSSIYIQDTFIRITPFYDYGFELYASGMAYVELYNVVIHETTQPRLNFYSGVTLNITQTFIGSIYDFSLTGCNNFVVSRSEVYMNRSNILTLVDTRLSIIDSTFNVTISAVFSSDDKNITICRSTGVSLLLDMGYAEINDSEIYELVARDTVELYNVTVLSVLAYMIKVENGELNIIDGVYSGTGISSTVFMDSLTDVSAARTVILGLLAVESTFWIDNVYAIENLNITNSIGTINATSIEPCFYDVLSEGFMIVYNSNLTLNNSRIYSMAPIPVFNSTLVIDSSNLDAELYAYLSNITIVSSEVYSIMTGFLPAYYGLEVTFDDKGVIEIDNSYIDVLFIVTEGDHEIVNSYIDCFGTVISNVSVINSIITYLAETYYWNNDGELYYDDPTGYYKYVTAIPIGTTTIGVTVTTAIVNNGTVNMFSSTLWALIANHTGDVYAWNITIVREIRLLGDSSVRLEDSSMTYSSSTILLYDDSLLDLSNTSGISDIIAMGSSSAYIYYVLVANSITMFNFSYLRGELVNMSNLFLYNYSIAELNMSIVTTNLIVISNSQLTLYNSEVSSYISALDSTTVATYDSFVATAIVARADFYSYRTEIDYIEGYEGALIEADFSEIYYMTTMENCVAVIRNSRVESLSAEEGEVYLYNVTYITGAGYSIESYNAYIYGYNLTTTSIGIRGFHSSGDLYTGYDGTNPFAFIYLENSNITHSYGMHYVISGRGEVIFNNGIINDPWNTTETISIYNNTVFSTIEQATFYITGNTTTEITNYELSNGRFISAMFVSAMFISQPTDETAPVINVLTDREITKELGYSPIEICWEIIEENPWYYEIYFNDTLIYFDLLLGEANVSIDASRYIEEPGLYLITLKAFDLAQNVGTSNITFLNILPSEPPQITVTPNLIEFEIDMIPRNITWIVTDHTPNIYEIYLNDALFATGNYSSGDEIVFPTAIEITSSGTHNVTLVAYDGVGNVAESTVEVTAYPAEAPQITSHPEQTYNITSGEYILLNWTAADRYPGNYIVTVNDSQVKAGVWASNQVITYNFTQTEPGTYVVRIVFMDQADHPSINTVTINVQPKPGPPPSPLGGFTVVIVLVAIASVFAIIIVVSHIKRR